MKKGQIYEGRVYRYSFPNKGYVKVDDRDICIKGALLGQQVRFSVKRMKKGAGEGRLLEVLEKSYLEDVTPCCPSFGQCGGCTYQTLSYENQLKIKEQQMKKLFSKVILSVDNFVDNVDKSDNLIRKSEICDGIGGGEIDSCANADEEVCCVSIDNIWDGIKGSPVTEAYRNKMEYSFGDEYKDGPLALGMHRKGGFHDIVTVDHCRIVDDDYNVILRAVLDFYTEKQVPFYRKMQHVGILRHLVVRQAAGSKDILVNLVTTTKEDLNAEEGAVDSRCEEKSIDPVSELRKRLYLDELVEKLLSLKLGGKIVGILHTHNDSLSDAVIPQRVVKLYGQDYLYEDMLGLKFKISPFSFFQTNTRSAEVLYETARDYVLGGGKCDIPGAINGENGQLKDKVIFDLYSGTGTIAQMLAPVAKKVVGVEIVEEAVEAAKENAELNGLDNCEFIAGDVLKVLDEIEEKPDIIVLDPPRDGCNPKALLKIIDYGVPEMVYISCKPTSLARDLVTLQAHGYYVKRMCAIDQFPKTVHVECVIKLQRRDM